MQKMDVRACTTYTFYTLIDKLHKKETLIPNKNANSFSMEKGAKNVGENPTEKKNEEAKDHRASSSYSIDRPTLDEAARTQCEVEK